MAGDKRAARLGVLAAVALMLFGALGARLWFLQTVEASGLQEQVDARNITTVQLRPERGQIFDADGRLLAGNQQTLNVVVDWASIRRDSDRAELFRRLSGWVRQPVEVMEDRYDANIYDPLRPMPIAEDVGEEIAAGLTERVEDFPGVSIEVGYRRVYPYAPLASHVIGYMGAITEEDAQRYDDLGYDISAVGEDVGRAGVEGYYETTLHGEWGEIVYEVDSHNRVVREISRREPVDGNDIQLSLDLDVQLYAERILQQQLRNRRDFVAENRIVDKPDGSRQRMDLNSGPWVHYEAPAGSVIVMNHETGQIIAMASYPTFDNRWFSQNISGGKYRELFNTLIDTPECGDEGQPVCREDPDQAAIVNRAIQGQYNMGSTFKVFVAWAALNSGTRSAGTWIDDQGTYTATSIEDDVCATGVKCVWRNSFCVFSNGPCVYGSIDMYWSLAVSSDVYYYQLGEQMYLTPGSDHRLLQDQVANFGFGRDPGIDLPYAFDGRLPYEETKQELIENGALAQSEQPRVLVGDVVNLAIGQGLLAASPLQLAVGYGAFANGGYVMVPQVVSGIYPPNTPAGADAGYVDTAGVAPLAPFVPTGAEIAMPEGTSQILGGLRENILGGRHNGRSTTAGELFDVGYPDTAIPLAGKTGTAQGRYSYPWNDSSVFAAFSIDPDQPYTVVAYLEKSGFGSQGAAPIVKCVFLGLSGLIPFDAPSVSEPLDPTSDQLAAPLPRVDETCMMSTTANTVHPGGSIVNGRPVD